MLPQIALVLSVEMIRDGGSLAAIFHGSNGAEYWLFFKVKSRTLPSGEMERFAYEKPVVIERGTNQEFKSSWQQAVVLLDQMRPMLRSEADRKWLESMYSTAMTAGQVPAAIDRVLGVPRKLFSDGQSDA